MKRKVFIKLNFIFGLIFLVGLGIILVVVNPLEANIFVFIVFYLIFFSLLITVLNLISAYIRIPYWLRILIAVVVVFMLIVQANKV